MVQLMSGFGFLMYAIDTINVVLVPVPIPDSTSLWGLKQHLVRGLKKIKHVNHPNNSHSGYTIFLGKYSLVSMTPYEEAEDIGELCKLPRSAITKTDQRNEERKWTAKHEHHGTFQNIIMVLTSIFE